VGGWLTPRPGRFTLGGRDLEPIVQEAGLAPGSVWTGKENLAPTGFVPLTAQSTHGTIRRIFMDFEMQKANHNGSTGDQITAVYSVNNTNHYCCDSKHKQVTTDLVMSSGTSKFMHTQYVSEKSDCKIWKLVKDLRPVVLKTFFLKSSVT
jgi:hypothetical protein